ncbi:MAG: hypothetical protein LBD77_09555 [Bifidobacteriaceae bacterium]|jgi:hypothetical protein|nr:hypothetical protein [Bifidobacteriaceae bacterium]
MLKRVIGGAIAALLIVGGSALAANAAVTRAWNSSSNPLKVAGYGSTGWAYGSFTVSTGSDGTKARGTNAAKYSNADNHKVYVKQITYVNAGYCVASEYLSCSQAYYKYTENDSTHINVVNTWKAANTKTSVPGTADYAKGGFHVKLDIPLRGDPGSGQSLTKGVNY